MGERRARCAHRGDRHTGNDRSSRRTRPRMRASSTLRERGDATVCAGPLWPEAFVSFCQKHRPEPRMTSSFCRQRQLSRCPDFAAFHHSNSMEWCRWTARRRTSSRQPILASHSPLLRLCRVQNPTSDMTQCFAGRQADRVERADDQQGPRDPAALIVGDDLRLRTDGQQGRVRRP